MAYNIEFSGAPDMDGETDTFFLCSVGRWQEFTSWVKSLGSSFPKLKELAKKGECKNSLMVHVELTDAIESGSPSAVVKNLADEILEQIGEGDVDETVRVTDD